MTELTLNNISLRAIEPDDTDTLYIWENDPSLWPYGTTRAPMSRHQIWQYVDSYDGDIFAAHQLRLMIVDKETSAAVGTVDLYEYDPRDGHAMVGIFIDSRFRRRGYASSALKLIEDYARRTVGMHQLAAMVAVDNQASVALFTKAGFKSRACLRSWIKKGRHYCDVLVFQKLFE